MPTIVGHSSPWCVKLQVSDNILGWNLCLLASAQKRTKKEFSPQNEEYKMKTFFGKMKWRVCYFILRSVWVFRGEVMEMYYVYTQWVVAVTIDMVMISRLKSCNERWTFSIVGIYSRGLSFPLRWKVRGLNARFEVEFMVF